MKSFFEEYGYVILAAVVVIILLGMVNPIGSRVQDAIEDTISTFDTRLSTSVSETFPSETE